jgi:uncharacterized protein with FMN-binding domain
MSRRTVLGMLIGLSMALSLGGCKFTEDIDKLVINDIGLASVKDGTYEGEQSNKPVTAAVRVLVQGGRIDSIKILSHGHGPGHGADAIVDRVVAAQSLKVDSVSGASYSSKVMLKAIENALEKGL